MQNYITLKDGLTIGEMGPLAISTVVSLAEEIAAAFVTSGELAVTDASPAPEVVSQEEAAPVEEVPAEAAPVEEVPAEAAPVVELEKPMADAPLE